MRRRPSQSTDEDAESSLESDCRNGQPVCPNTRSRTGRRSSSAARTALSNRINWTSPEGADGFGDTPAATQPCSPTLPQPSLTTSHANGSHGKEDPGERATQPPRSLWSLSRLSCGIALVGIIILGLVVGSFVARPSDIKGCRMSYMRPSYIHFSEFDTEHTRFATKYSLYLYREQGVDDERALNGIPVLFIPGNAGSYKQVRPIAAEAANTFYKGNSFDDGDPARRGLDFFTVDFNEDITAFHGQTLLDQAEYLNEAVRYILSLYSDPQRKSRESDLPDPTSVVILGHSMGGVVARAMLVQPNYLARSINTILTLSAPHARPPVTFDGQIVQIYDEINEYWRNAYAEQWASNNPLWQVTLVSIAGGSLDSVVPSDYARLESLVPETHGFTVFSTGIPTVWSAMDHQAILWCDQFRLIISKALLDIVDVTRASQTKPRAERMRIFKKAFLTGLETTSEHVAPAEGITTLLSLSESSKNELASRERLVIGDLSADWLSKGAGHHAHLLPIPSTDASSKTRFTFISNARLEDDRDAENHVSVLLCSLSPTDESVVPSSHFSDHLNLSLASEHPTQLACRNAARDRIALPASDGKSKHAFLTSSDRNVRHTPTFSYLQYNLDELSDYQYVIIVNKGGKHAKEFVVAEFADAVDYQLANHSHLSHVLTSGVDMRLPADRPTTLEIQFTSLKSALLAYDLTLRQEKCASGKKQIFQPMVRQYIEHPYESRYFVDTETASVTIHGVAPFMPNALGKSVDRGVILQLWSDPTCGSAITMRLRINVVDSLGKLYMRYRTVFAAFPLLIVTLVLRQQFRIYDSTAVFVSFSHGLDLCIRQSIPLLLLSMTLLSMSLDGAATAANQLLRCQHKSLSADQAFHQNELLIGTRDPFFWFLIPLIGVVCIGVCVGLHYATLAVTHAGALLYCVASKIRHASSSNTSRSRASSPAFVQSTPRRRMLTTAVLLFLVATFIPYQFAYLVACLVQLFTVIRAMRIHSSIASTANANYYNYAHSILLLMLWVLPINLPILAVWVRNLAVHWLTPFSSHHNVLSIMPFILLVENLTTGKMVPPVTSGLRFITSVLLFGTALCAAVYGVSHAYVLHYLVNFVAAWLVIVHSTSETWSRARLSAIFEDNADGARKRGKRP